MTRVSNADHVLLLLREQLHRMGRSRTGRSGKAGAGREATQGPLIRLQASAAVDQLSDEDFRKVLLRAVLTEELGEGIANDPNFQSIVDDVFRILSESEEGRGLIDRAAEQVRSAG
jgi:hypothetical protein